MPGIFVQASAIELAHIAERSRKSQSKFSCKRAQSRTIALSQMSKIEFTRILPWRAIALLRTCSGYAERSRIFVQASAIKFTWIAECSRKSWRKNLKEEALRHRTGLLTFPQAYCLPGSTYLIAYTGHFVPGYRRFAPYCLPGSNSLIKISIKLQTII